MPIRLCPACRLPAESSLSSLPCSDCRDALLFAPRICPACLGFDCPSDECTRPWIRVEGDPEHPTRFASIHAAYLSIGPGFRILKSWKTTRNPPLERYLQIGLRRAISPFDAHGEITLIPIPQSKARCWELFGGSTLRLCEMIERCRREKGLRARTLETLKLSMTPDGSQAKTRGAERYRKEARFEITESIGDLEGPILLVDDFLTSGSTLRTGLHTLDPSPKCRAHAFVLGFRPSLAILS